MIITRFAPSPTGELHVGGARTALFAFLFAKHHGGKFLLRIEDTDRERYIPESVGHIIEALDWLGMTPDNRNEIVTQSERLPIYKKYALELLASGNAYICTCSKEKLAADRERQTLEKQPPRYEGHCREINTSLKDAEGGNFVIRMKMPKEGSVTVKDLIRGDVVFDISLFDDQVLLKSDGYPTYHLASIIDDHEMNITHVIRAEEWLPSTPKHILLYQMFGWTMPEFAHLPMILAPDKSKLSKRHGATGVFEYKKLGYLPDAMVNFIALLGWHLTEDKEILTMDELIKNFSLERVQKGGAVFDIQKLNWLNSEYIKKKTSEELFAMISGIFGEKEVLVNDKETTMRLLELGKTRMEKLSDFTALKESFQTQNYEGSMLVYKNKTKEEATANLSKVQEILRGLLVHEFNLKNLETMVMPFANVAGRGDVLWPLRVALSGKDKSPGPFEIMDIIGKDESLRRIEIAIKKLQNEI